MTTMAEKVVLGHLADAWNQFIALDVQHPSDRQEFMQAIHAAQGIVACRIARRVDPVMWPDRIHDQALFDCRDDWGIDDD